MSQYLYIRHNNLYLLAITKRNSNAAEILLFLHKVVEVFTEYFKELEEESIRDNFVVIYELLDEMMDFGYPQTTETKILQEYITQESHKLEVQARPPIAVTNAVSWRSEGIRYRKNEVFLDVVESLNLLVSATGNVLRSEILGAIKMKCYLSGMPELRLGLNDKVMFETTGRATRGKAVEMEDVKFHQCVRLSRFENDRTISFIPPDGEFELMSYRLNTQVKPLIWVECIVENHSGSRIEYMLKAKAQFKRRSTANNVEIIIPVPEDADTPRFRTNIGSVHYAPEQSAIVWKIKQFGGGKEFLMRAELGLPSVRGDDEKGGGMMGGFGGSMGGVGERGKGKRPINVKFEIPYFTTSGIQVRYLKIIEPKVSSQQYGYWPMFTDLRTAAIPVLALGQVHHSVWRHCCETPRRTGLNRVGQFRRNTTKLAMIARHKGPMGGRERGWQGPKAHRLRNARKDFVPWSTIETVPACPKRPGTQHIAIGLMRNGQHIMFTSFITQAPRCSCFQSTCHVVTCLMKSCKPVQINHKPHERSAIDEADACKTKQKHSGARWCVSRLHIKPVRATHAEDMGGRYILQYPGLRLHRLTRAPDNVCMVRRCCCPGLLRPREFTPAKDEAETA